MTLDKNSLKHIINQQPKVMIVTHKSPDGDAMGSSLGLRSVLLGLKCDVQVVAPTEYPSFLNWIEGNEDVLTWGIDNQSIETLAESADVIFCLDFNALSRIDEVGDLVRKSAAKKVMIDHHQQPEDFADLMISDTSACSTSQLVYEFIVEFGWSDYLTPGGAEALYCGIMTDTGSFRFPSTCASTHRVIADLIDKGANNSMIHRRIYDSNSYERLRLLGHCLLNMDIMPQGVVVMQISKADHVKFNIQKGDTEGLVNYGLSMPEVKCSAFFREDKGIIKISFRSKDDFDVNQLARKHFNGGGHINAAGGMSNDSLESAIAKFKSIIQNEY